MEKYSNAATDEDVPRELLLGQSESQVEYDRAGRIIKGQVRSVGTAYCFVEYLKLYANAIFFSGWS